jgi:hypothetical protein
MFKFLFLKIQNFKFQIFESNSQHHWFQFWIKIQILNFEFKILWFKSLTQCSNFYFWKSKTSIWNSISLSFESIHLSSQKIQKVFPILSMLSTHTAVQTTSSCFFYIIFATATGPLGLLAQQAQSLHPSPSSGRSRSRRHRRPSGQAPPCCHAPAGTIVHQRLPASPPILPLH